MKQNTFYLIVVFLFVGIHSKGQNRPSSVPFFFNQSFQVTRLTSPIKNSLAATYVGDGRMLYVSDASSPFSANSKYRLWNMDLISEKSKRVNTKNLCEINSLKYNVGGVTVDDSNSFMIAAINDASINDFMVQTRMTLLHIDLSHGFSQCATPPFVRIGNSYTHPFFDDKSGYLYFTSDIPGGKGGLDIYRVLKIGPNEWGEVEPVEEVNTPNNDVYPYIHDDGRLYYSTLTATSGYDVYTWDFDRRSYPSRLPAPVNSKVDDFNFFIISGKDAIVARSSSNSDYSALYRLLAF